MLESAKHLRAFDIHYTYYEFEQKLQFNVEVELYKLCGIIKVIRISQ